MLTGNEPWRFRRYCSSVGTGTFEVAEPRHTEKTVLFPHVCLHVRRLCGASPTVSGEPPGMLPQLQRGVFPSHFEGSLTACAPSLPSLTETIETL